MPDGTARFVFALLVASHCISVALSQRSLLERRSKDQVIRPLIDLELEQNFQAIKASILEAAAHDARSLAREQGTDLAGTDEHSLQGGRKFCYQKEYRKRMFKAVKEAPFIGLFSDLHNITQFEGSSITYAKHAYWVVYDSLRAIGKIDLQFQFRGSGNKLIPEDVGEKESQFEGLQYMPSTDSFIAVRETTDHATHGLVPLIEELKVNKDETSWTLASVCPVKFYELEDENKGWESIWYFENGEDRMMMGLCESNYCKTIVGPDAPGLDRGNGRLILTQLSTEPDGDDEDTCHWEVKKKINLPKEAYFLDYAGIAFYPGPQGRRVAIVSQEDAAIWVGEFDWEALEFVPGGEVYHFPRDIDCQKTYCNVEGLTFLDNQRLIIASDRSKTTQSYRCMVKDQSAHIMAIPR